MDDSRRYVFAPLEQRGLLLGLRGPQVAALGAGLLVAFVSMQAGALGPLVAIVVMAVSVALAFVPVGGRPLDLWLPAAWRFAVSRVNGSGRTRPPTRPVTRPRADVGARARRRARSGRRVGARSAGELPSSLSGVSLREVERAGGRGPMAVIVDRAQQTMASVLAVRGQSFALLDGADKERRLAAWSDVLSSMARDGGPVRVIQWVERTTGGDAESFRRHAQQRVALAPAAAPVRSYRQLIEGAGPLAQEHECFVVLGVDAGRGWRRGGRRADGSERDDAAMTVLAREMRLLEGQLQAADIDVRGALDLRQLHAAVRTAHDPASRPGLARRTSTYPELAGVEAQGAWPVATETAWGWYRTDGMVHATFWIAEWPRLEVGPDFLAPLLLGTSSARSISLVMRPTGTSRGVREAEAARTATAADDELRRRAGFLATARRRRDAEGIARREAELANGHAAYQFSGYVTVTAATTAELEDHAADVAQAAHQCRLDVRRLYGVQDVAWTWSLPLGRGVA